MKISVIVERSIEKSTKEAVEDIVKMFVELSERYPCHIDTDDVQITFKI